MIDWGDVLGLTSAFSAGLILVFTGLILRRSDRRRRRFWLSVAFGGLAAYWLFYYAYSLSVHYGIISNPLVPVSQFGPVFVRPGLTVTLALMACGLIWQYYERPVEL